jgi:hypothetical protein
MSGYAITKQQKDYLATLVCQRISDDAENRELIEGFTNFRNPALPYALRKGWNADKKDKVAYYIVKNPADNELLLFFSLKCGEMHIPLDPAKLEKSVENALALLKAAYGMEAPEWAADVIEKRKVDGRLPPDVFYELEARLEQSTRNQSRYNDEMQVEGDNIIRTKKTFAAVELVHFCVHDPARERWEAMGMSQGIGRTMFWQLVEPIVQNVRDLVGCEYIYLFAAGADKNGPLTGYYKSLGFDFRDDISVNKPAYDFSCFFMCQEVTSLRKRKRDFFKSYNKPKEPAAI